jgi:hypothetical protein
MFSKKGVGPVIASGLLLVVAIVAIVGFQTWFNNYSTVIFSDVETQSGDSVSSSNIDSIIDGTLYFKNSGTNNITISSLKVGSVDCNVSQSLSPGVSSIDVSSCVNGTVGSNDVVVISNQKVFSKKIFFSNPVNSTTSNEEETVATDEYFSNVVLLIQSETSDGSTTFNDSSNISNNVGVNGDVKHNTSVSKFGSSSIYFDGLGDFLNITDNNDLDFGTGDFTVEYWGYLNQVKNNGSSMRVRNVFVDKNGYYSGSWLSGYGSCGADVENVLLWHSSGCIESNTDILSLNTWHHIAINRNGTNLSMYVDGIRIASGSNSVDYSSADEEIVIGAPANPAIRPSVNRDLDGHMEEIRLTKGIARYNDEFTPPTSAFPTE